MKGYLTPDCHPKQGNNTSKTAFTQQEISLRAFFQGQRKPPEPCLDVVANLTANHLEADIVGLNKIAANVHPEDHRKSQLMGLSH